MHGYPVSGLGLMQALRRAGVELPENTRHAELHMPLDDCLFLRLDVVVDREDLPKIMLAMQEVHDARD